MQRLPIHTEKASNRGVRVHVLHPIVPTGPSGRERPTSGPASVDASECGEEASR